MIGIDGKRKRERGESVQAVQLEEDDDDIECHGS